MTIMIIIGLCVTLLLIIAISIISRVNASDDDDPPTITIHPPLPLDDGKW